MSDQGTHHSEGETAGELKSKTAFRSSFWFVIILVGLFIAALNFIDVIGHSEGHRPHEAEEHHTMEATANGTLKGESGLGREKDSTTQHHGAVTAHDTIDREGHQ